jgi:predicted cobalt transporter CbtA
MSLLEGFLWGLAGGFLAELLGLFRLRHHDPGRLPRWLQSPFYWIVTAFMILAGGLLVLVYMKSGIAVAPVLAVNVGASAPLIIGQLVAQAPRVEPGRTD